MKYQVHLEVALKLQNKSYQNHHQTMKSHPPTLMQTKLIQYMKMLKYLQSNPKMLLPKTSRQKIIQHMKLVYFNCQLASYVAIELFSCTVAIHIDTQLQLCIYSYSCSYIMHKHIIFDIRCMILCIYKHMANYIYSLLHASCQLSKF